MRYWVISFLLAFLVCGFHSCKKGCTNSGALNYNPSAKVDDAGCVFCNMNFLDSGIHIDWQRDERPTSYYYNTLVVKSTTTSELYQIAGNGCPHTNDSACNSGSSFRTLKYTDLTLQNILADTMVISAKLKLYTSSLFLAFDTTLIDRVNSAG
jgi:hypothetical protein